MYVLQKSRYNIHFLSEKFVYKLFIYVAKRIEYCPLIPNLGDILNVTYCNNLFGEIASSEAWNFLVHPAFSTSFYPFLDPGITCPRPLESQAGPLKPQDLSS